LCGDGWSRLRAAITATHKEYVSVTGCLPEWFHVGINSSLVGRHPSSIITSQNLGMKVAFWSTRLVIERGAPVNENQLTMIRDDLKSKNGGSFIYVTIEGENEGNRSLSGVLRLIRDELALINREESHGVKKVKFGLLGLSSVAKDAIPMVL